MAAALLHPRAAPVLKAFYCLDSFDHSRWYNPQGDCSCCQLCCKINLQTSLANAAEKSQRHPPVIHPSSTRQPGHHYECTTAALTPAAQRIGCAPSSPAQARGGSRAQAAQRSRARGTPSEAAGAAHGRGEGSSPQPSEGAEAEGEEGYCRCGRLCRSRGCSAPGASLCCTSAHSQPVTAARSLCCARPAGSSCCAL